LHGGELGGSAESERPLKLSRLLAFIFTIIAVGCAAQTDVLFLYKKSVKFCLCRNFCRGRAVRSVYKADVAWEFRTAQKEAKLI
jgi:hypothetical protein